MQPLERLEQLARVLGIEAGAVVADVVARGCVPARCRSELDRRIVPTVGELPGITQQVFQHRPDERAFRQGMDGPGDNEMGGPVRVPALDFRGDPRRLLADIDRLQLQFGLRDTRDLHQVIDQPRHLLADGDDPLGVLAAFLAENVSVLLEQGPAVPAEAPERGPQVVRYRVDETVQALTGTFQIPQPELSGTVPDGRGDQDARTGVDRGQGDLGREGTGIVAAFGQRRVHAYHPVPRVSHEPGPVPRVRRARLLRDQDLDQLADKLLALVAAQPLRLAVDQDHPAVGGDAHHRVRNRLKERHKCGVWGRGQRCGHSHNLYCSSYLWW